MALSLCKELTLQGYSVPQDIAISGFDDVRDARANVPPLTTCYVSVSDMAKKAMETIDILLNGKEAPAARLFLQKSSSATPAAVNPPR